MYLYNTTFSVEKEAIDKFLQEIKEYFIVPILEANVLHSPKLYKVFYENEDGSVNYALQFETDDEMKLAKFIDNDMNRIVLAFQNRFSTSVLSFSTIMKKENII